MKVQVIWLPIFAAPQAGLTVRREVTAGLYGRRLMFAGYIIGIKISYEVPRKHAAFRSRRGLFSGCKWWRRLLLFIIAASPAMPSLHPEPLLSGICLRVKAAAIYLCRQVNSH